MTGFIPAIAVTMSAEDTLWENKGREEHKINYKDSFSSFHPVVNFTYFVLVIGFSMFLMHPACLLISLLCGISYAVYQSGGRAVRFCLIYSLPLLLFTAVINPAFSHEGVTILAYLPSGNPLTAESIAYGAAAGVMMASVIIWFRCYNDVFTSDKFIYLFGRIIPSLSLVLSMALRFIPKFHAQMKSVNEAQKSIGRDVSSGGVLSRIKNAVKIVSIMITWSLENAIETADSMKSRGYGLPGRTAFSVYRFDSRDKETLLWLIFCGVYVLSGCVSGGLYFRYFPSVSIAKPDLLNYSFIAAYAALCITPLAINIKEDRKWKRLKYGI